MDNKEGFFYRFKAFLLQEYKSMIGSVLFSFTFLFLLKFYGQEIIAGRNYVNTLISQFWINLAGVIVILIVGILLYVLRQRQRIWYGVLEISFASAYGWYAINKVETTGYVELLSIIAAVYLVVRGVDNFMEGRKEREEFEEEVRQIILQRAQRTND
jgi:hypothetical protein